MFRVNPQRVATPQRPQPLAPWDCAEWCWQKWWAPGSFKEYQQCVDACREKWWSAKPGVPGEAGDADLDLGRQHGAQGVWRPDLSHFGARGPYGQGWREARQQPQQQTFAQQYDAFIRQANPIEGMPGGSVSGCIKMHADKNDPGAYCAAIADRIEPGWRKHNPGGV